MCLYHVTIAYWTAKRKFRYAWRGMNKFPRLNGKKFASPTDASTASCVADFFFFFFFDFIHPLLYFILAIYKTLTINFVGPVGNCTREILRPLIQNNCYASPPPACPSWIRSRWTVTARNIENATAASSPRAITWKPTSGNFRAAFTPFMREVRRTQNYARESVTRHSPRVFLATRAREVCCERPLNHNRNGGRIALRPKCTLVSDGGFLFAFGRFRGRARYTGLVGRSMEFSALIRFFFPSR